MKRIVFISVALAVMACSESGGEALPPPGTSPGDDVSEPGPDVSQIETDGTEPIDEPPPVRPGRVPTRMTIETLARSIPIITGGIQWIEDFGQGPIDMLAVLAPTLGAPDYLLVTDENLEPSLIIAKFMQDAAARLCGRWIAIDQNAEPGARTLVTASDDWKTLDPELVRANLRRLQLRFFARYVPPGEEAPIADLYDLFLAASGAAPSGSEAADGWLSVCLAMMTDPALVIY